MYESINDQDELLRVYDNFIKPLPQRQTKNGKISITEEILVDSQAMLDSLSLCVLIWT